jgi:hypothetical protein
MREPNCFRQLLSLQSHRNARYQAGVGAVSKNPHPKMPIASFFCVFFGGMSEDFCRVLEPDAPEVDPLG